MRSNKTRWTNRLLTKYVIGLQPDTYEHLQTLSKVFAGCSKRPFGKAAASEYRKRTLWGARCDE